MDTDSQPDMSNATQVDAPAQLTDWMQRHRVTGETLTEALGLSSRSVWNWRRPGGRVPVWLAAIVACDDVPEPVKRLRARKLGRRSSQRYKARVRAASAARLAREKAQPETRGQRANVVMGSALGGECGACGGLLVLSDYECPACGRALEGR